MGLERLSTRETECVTLAARGLGNDQIAYELGIASSTVANTLRNAYQKLGVNSRQGAAKALGISYLGARMPMGGLPEPVSGGGAPADGATRPLDGERSQASWLAAPYLRIRRGPPRLFGSVLPTILGWTLLGLVIMAALIGLLNAVYGSGDPVARSVVANTDRENRR